MQRIVVLLSGQGSNLQALMDACNRGDLPARIAGVIGNREDAYGLERALQAGIPTRLLRHTAFPDRDSFDRVLADKIDAFAPDWVVLAGFMRVLTPAFVQRYRGRLVNIHPSLLPKYPGLDTHGRALRALDDEAGATVHFVTEDLDGGPVIARVRVPIAVDDTVETLTARVLSQEHQLYPAVLKGLVQGRLRLADNGKEVYRDEQVLPPHGLDWPTDFAGMDAVLADSGSQCPG